MNGPASPPPIPKQAEWYFSKNGETSGPVSLSALTDLLRNGEISRDTHVWRDGMNAWEPISQIDLFLNPPPVQPPLNNTGSNATIVEKPKSKWFWPKVVIGSLCGLFLVANLIRIAAESSPELTLMRKGAWMNNDGQAIEITNVGSKPITISDILINDREDCSVSSLDDLLSSKSETMKSLGMGSKSEQRRTFRSSTLKVGDRLSYVSSCRVIRVNVQTDQGSGSYEFDDRR